MTYEEILHELKPLKEARSLRVQQGDIIAAKIEGEELIETCEHLEEIDWGDYCECLEGIATHVGILHKKGTAKAKAWKSQGLGSESIEPTNENE